MLRRSISLLVFVTLIAALAVPSAIAKTNASAAAGFVEQSRNDDGGYPAAKGSKSDPDASLWASVALLAVGKNPRDEFNKNGASAEQYLAKHKDGYTSLEQLGLLTMIQSGSTPRLSPLGHPADKLKTQLTQAAVHDDPRGAAIAVFGLLTAGDAKSRERAGSTARSLLAARTSDGGWGLRGNADSAATALVVLALAKTHTATASSTEVKSGLAYLRQAQQPSDGSIVRDTRTDKSTHHGSVSATAFTLQAMTALGVDNIRTKGGKTVRQGLVSYQQHGTGGLNSNAGAYDTAAKASVIETAQALPAFDGKSFPLRAVAATTHGPPTSRTGAKGHDQSSNQVSGGTAAQGLTGSNPSATSDPGAFAGGVANGNNKPNRNGAGSGAGKALKDLTGNGAGTSVTGTVVGAGPRLAARAGASDTGLTNSQRATIALATILALMFAFGAVAERQGLGAAGAGAGVVAAGRPVLHGASRLSGITAVRSGNNAPPRRRWPLVLLILLGAAVMTIPVATKMTERAPKGAKMISAFEPYMQPGRVASLKRDLNDIAAYANELETRTGGVLYPTAGTPQAQHQKLLDNTGQVALFSNQWADVNKTFSDLVGRIDRNKGNYQAVASLPSFQLFSWFFLIPGALLVFLGIAGLLLGRLAWTPMRRAALAIGVGLFVAPVLFQMYTRAPQGAEMVKDFKPIETRATVQKVQADFATITLGDGGIAAELVPAFHKKGLTDKQIATQLPGQTTLDQRWTKILNNMTPMIAVMSDNVVNYQAIEALPSFNLFPWLFLTPGLLAIGLVLLAGRRPRGRESRAPEPQGAT